MREGLFAFGKDVQPTGIARMARSENSSDRGRVRCNLQGKSPIASIL
jgi:hypothetical protein